MISSAILLAVVACAHAHQVHTVYYFGDNAQAILEKEPTDTITIPAGECELLFPLTYGVGCLGISALKIEVEDEAKVYIKHDPSTANGYVARLPGKCGSPATVTFAKKCRFYPGDQPEFKRPLFGPKGYGPHF